MALTKAKFYIEQEKKTLQVHFNPSEYTITSTGQSRDNAPYGTKNDQLSFKLYFDTYMLDSESLLQSALGMQSREDVRIYTEPIAALANWTNGKRPLVSFIWGSLRFKGVITAVTQNFTMFMDDGKPVRAALDITMQRADDDSASQDAGGDSLNWADGSWKSKVDSKIGKARDLLER